MRQRRTFARFAAVIAVFGLIAAACGDDDDDDDAATTDAASTESSPADTDAPATTAATEETDAPGTTEASATTEATETTEPASDIVTGGSLILGIDGEAACYLPSGCSVSYGPGAARFAVLENLVRPANNDEGYELLLAESIEPNADFTQFTVKLKPDVLYSDGTPLTAGDIKTLFDTYVFGEGSTLRGNVAVISSTEAPDDSTVVFTLSAPQAPFPVSLTNIPIWKPEPGMTQTSLPIGTGPFKFESWEPNVALEMTRNENYWGEADDGTPYPYLDAVTVIPITAGDTRVNSLESGEIDLAMSIDPLVTTSMSDVAEVMDVPLNAGGGLFFNNSSPPTDDLRVRQALTYAMNKDDVLAAIGGGVVRDQYYVEESPWYSDEAAEISPTFDQDEARRLLDEYINDPARSDGKAAGESLTIDLAHVQGAITQQSIAAVAQQQWQDVGVEVSITPKDQPTLIGDAISGNFNINYFGWATPHPFSLLVRNYGPWPETPTNYTHFNSEEIFDIVGQMAVTDSQDDMNALIQESNVVLAEGSPLIWLHSTSVAWGIGENVGNIELLAGNGFLEWTTLSRAG